MQHLGITDTRRWDFSERDRTQMVREANRAKKKAFDDAFVQACLDVKARIVKVHSEWIVEDISDHIRNWFREMYDISGEFDKYPPALKGGTILVLRGETMSPVEFGVFVRRRNEMGAMSPAERKKVRIYYHIGIYYHFYSKQIADDEKKEKAKEKAKKKAARLELAQLKAEKKLQQAKDGFKTWDFNEPEFVTKNFRAYLDAMKS